jgi:hypothetical protein
VFASIMKLLDATGVTVQSSSSLLLPPPLPLPPLRPLPPLPPLPLRLSVAGTSVELRWVRNPRCTSADGLLVDRLERPRSKPPLPPPPPPLLLLLELIELLVLTTSSSPNVERKLDRYRGVSVRSSSKSWLTVTLSNLETIITWLLSW